MAGNNKTVPNSIHTAAQHASSWIPFLNYIVFFILYLLSFVFMFKPYTELLGIALLFIVHAFTSIFIMKDVFSLDSSLLQKFVPMITQLTIPIAMIFHFISLIMLFVMLYSLHSTYTTKYGFPITIPPQYIEQFTIFKNIFIVNFVLCAGLLFTLNAKPLITMLN